MSEESVMSDSESDVHASGEEADRNENSSSTSSSTNAKRYRGAATYRAKFKPSWNTKWPCIRSVPREESSFQCTVCHKKLSCKHQGERDVTRHLLILEAHSCKK